MGEVKAVGKRYVMTQKGTLLKEKFYFPKYLVKDYDGQKIWFDVSEDELKRFTHEEPPIREDLGKYQKGTMSAGAEAIIPVIEEKLQVSKTTVTEEAIMVKEPVTEYKLIEVPIVREELKIVRRLVPTGTIPAKIEAAGSDNEGEIRILLSREEVQVTKKSYVFEEVLIRREKVTDIKTISETVTKERVDTQALVE